ncbi:MAG: hypothetical protein U1D36_18810 [Hydrogenophaga sp.]|jgi:hypothetical protein|uniref:hypothetical protein n=1 Tax=Hydrogenophaga sp. TaxID=1904254 RepID=UPI002731174A|nr:hypothetical protein [Hydrogenophaga sp.]MDP2407132.1 hypothetical protein [Hydrogenophaga sp.]MDZ4176508.1 hypothetical protein [Hydrogenophaga sp.]
MKTSLALIALCAWVLLLGACDKTPVDPTAPEVNQPAPNEYGATQGPATDPSLPPAESVFPPGTNAKTDPTLGETDGTRMPKQESDVKLLPGQNNDHSAPLSPAK